MAKPKSITPERFLRTLFPDAALRRAARETGFVQRERKVDAVAFCLVVVLSVCGRGGQRLASMRRALSARTGVELARSAFWRRFSPAFERLVDWMLDEVMSGSQQRRTVNRGVLRGFSDVLAVDSTVIAVHESLQSVWRGTRRNSSPAALKVHTWVRATKGELLRYLITPEVTADKTAFEVGDWVKGALVLFDRGYDAASLWWRVHHQGGFFLTRLPAKYNPVIKACNRTHRGRARKLIDLKLKPAMDGLRRQCIDVQCAFTIRFPPGEGTPGETFQHEFRVVGVQNPSTGEYHLYVTNIPHQRIAAEDLEHLYRLRWEVETFYKVGKSGLGLDELTSRKPHIIRTLIKAALLRSCVAMQAKCLASQNLPPDRWINPMQWVQVWYEALRILIDDRLAGRPPSARTTWPQLARLATDPNRARAPTRYWMQHVSPLQPAI